MSQFTLELITSHDSSYQLQTFIDLGLVNHVHKRIESFYFLDEIASSAVPLDYLETSELDSKYNVFIADRTHGVAANSSSRLDSHIGHEKVSVTSFTSAYAQILATNQVFVDEYNLDRPLFYKHVLPSDTVSVKLESVESGNLVTVSSGYKVDLDAGAVYTNYHNFYDQTTGAYRLYFLISTSSLGQQTKTLLSPAPVVSEATWEDIDPETGELYADRLVYSKEQNTSGYTFYFNVSDEWHIKPLAKSFIKPIMPTGRKSDESWYLRVSNGDVTTIQNDAARRYWLPEYYKQPFQPSLPYIFNAYNKMLFVDSKTIAATRGFLAISPADGRHITLYIYDYQMTLLKLWTTNTALASTTYSDSGVSYEVDKINCWDNRSGLIVLNEAILPGQQFFAQYYYEAEDLEYSKINLNPIQNKFILNQSVVFYVVPNADSDDRGLHYLLVEADGRISYCSQELGYSYPSLQLLTADGAYNPNNIIGLKYISDQDEDTFVTLYTTGNSNNYAYLLLAEVNVIDRSILSQVVSFDVRQDGDTLKDQATTTYEKNPKVLQSRYGFGEDGAAIPQNNVVVIQVPLELLEEYGGYLQKDKATELLKKYLTAGLYPLIEWIYPTVDVTCDVSVAAEVNLSWTWEGPDYAYRLYRRFNSSDEWILIYETSSETPVTLTYQDTDLTSGDAVYYEVRVFKEIEYPAPYQNTVKVK